MPSISQQQWEEYQRLRNGGQRPATMAPGSQAGTVSSDASAEQPSTGEPTTAPVAAQSHPGLSEAYRRTVQATQEAMGPDSPFQYNPATNSWGPRPGVMSINAQQADALARAWTNAQGRPPGPGAPVVTTPTAGSAAPPVQPSQPTVPQQGGPMDVGQRNAEIQQQRQLQVANGAPALAAPGQERPAPMKAAWEQQRDLVSAQFAQGQPGTTPALAPVANASAPTLRQAYSAQQQIQATKPVVPTTTPPPPPATTPRPPPSTTIPTSKVSPGLSPTPAAPPGTAAANTAGLGGVSGAAGGAFNPEGPLPGPANEAPPPPPPPGVPTSQTTTGRKRSGALF